MEDQFGPFVTGKSPRKADRQGVGIEQRAGGDDTCGADVLFLPALTRAFADEREQIIPERQPRFPELGVGNVDDQLPERRLVVPFAPVLRQVAVEE